MPPAIPTDGQARRARPRSKAAGKVAASRRRVVRAPSAGRPCGATPAPYACASRASAVRRAWPSMPSAASVSPRSQIQCRSRFHLSQLGTTLIGRQKRRLKKSKNMSRDDLRDPADPRCRSGPTRTRPGTKRAVNSGCGIGELPQADAAAKDRLDQVASIPALLAPTGKGGLRQRTGTAAGPTGAGSRSRN